VLKKISLAVLKIAAFVVVLALLASVVIVPIGALSGPAFSRTISFRLLGDGSLALATLIALMLMAFFVDKRQLASIGLTSSRFVDLLTGSVLGAMILAIPMGMLLITGAAGYAPNLGAFSASGLALALVACLINVIAQELLFRSYIFQELWAKFGALVATVVTTILFVAAHWNAITDGTAGVIAGANILLASLLLSFAYVRTGQLWLPIGIHLGWNGLQGPVLGINVTGNDLAFGHWSVFSFPGNALWTGGDMGVEGGLAGLVGPLMGIAIVAFAFKQQSKPDFSRVESATK
jgi:membrane protease YdiL (CAAX protease family)